MKPSSRSLKIFLCAALAGLAPGTAPYAALAQVISAAPSVSAPLGGGFGAAALGERRAGASDVGDVTGRTDPAALALPEASALPASPAAPGAVQTPLPAVDGVRALIPEAAVERGLPARAVQREEASPSVPELPVLPQTAPTELQARAMAREVAQSLDSAGPLEQAPAEAAGALGSRLLSILTGEQPGAVRSEDSLLPVSGELGDLAGRGVSARGEEPRAQARPAGKGIEEALRAQEEPAGSGAASLAAFTMAGALAALSPLALAISYLTLVLPAFILHEIGHARVADRLGDPWPKLAGRTSLRLKDMWSHKDPETGRHQLTHLDPIWTLLLPLSLILMKIPFGAARPVRVRARLLVNQKEGVTRTKGMALVAFAGPLINLTLALGFGLLNLGWLWWAVPGFLVMSLALALALGAAGRAAGVFNSREAVRFPALLFALSAAAGILQMLAPALGLPDFLGVGLSLGVFFNVLLGFFNLLPLAPLDGHYIARSLLADGLGKRDLAERYFGPAVRPPPGGLIVRLHADRPVTEDVDLDRIDGGLGEELSAQDRLAAQAAGAGLSSGLLNLFGARVAAVDKAANSALVRFSPEVSPSLRAYFEERGVRSVPARLDEAQLGQLIGAFKGELESAGFSAYDNSPAGVRAFLEDVPGAFSSPLGRKVALPQEWGVLQKVHWFLLGGTMILLGRPLGAFLDWVTQQFLSGSWPLALAAVPVLGALAFFLRALRRRRSAFSNPEMSLKRR